MGQQVGDGVRVEAGGVLRLELQAIEQLDVLPIRRKRRAVRVKREPHLEFWHAGEAGRCLAAKLHGYLRTVFTQIAVAEGAMQAQ
jgi:hypothetical protein